jgi:NADP-dependent 3-hydroxy acid dehydrogenase YdfG
VDTAVQTYGRIDVLINNAGLMPQSLLERLKMDEWDRMIDVNIKGVLDGIAAALPYMKEQKSGHIIYVSSVAGHKVRPGSTVYAATKHAVRALSEGLRIGKNKCRSAHSESRKVLASLVERMETSVDRAKGAYFPR